MGKTVPSYRMALEREISDWKRFAKGLISREDREVFEQLMDACRNHASAGSNATRPVVFEAMTMSILLFQQKLLDKIEKEIDKITKKTSSRYDRPKQRTKEETWKKRARDAGSYSSW